MLLVGKTNQIFFLKKHTIITNTKARKTSYKDIKFKNLSLATVMSISIISIQSDIQHIHHYNFKQDVYDTSAKKYKNFLKHVIINV